MLCLPAVVANRLQTEIAYSAIPALRYPSEHFCAQARNACQPTVFIFEGSGFFLASITDSGLSPTDANSFYFIPSVSSVSFSLELVEDSATASRMC